MAVASAVHAQRLRAEADLLQRAAARLEKDAPQAGPLDDLAARWNSGSLPNREALERLLSESSQALGGELAALERTLAEQLGQAQAAWVATRGTLAQQRREVQESELQRRSAGAVATLLSVDQGWFWLCGAVSIAVVLAVVVHDRRRELRRRLNGLGTRSMTLLGTLAGLLVVLVTLAIVTFVWSDQLRAALASLDSGRESEQTPHPRPSPVRGEGVSEESPAADASTDVAALETRLSSARAAYEKAVAAWNSARKVPADGAAGWVRQSAEYRQRVVAVAVDAQVLEWLPTALAADRKRLEELRQSAQSESATRAAYVRWRPAIRAALGFGLMGLTACAAAWFLRDRKRRLAAIAETCPLCLGRGFLEYDPASPPPPPLPDHGPALNGFAAVRCRNLIGRQPPEYCDYTFASAYRELPKLCFPTLGVPQAGKTHWLAMVYWVLNRGDYARAVQFERIKSRGSEDFDVIVEEILNSRIGTAATQRERIPHPVVFNFRDRDRLGRANLLVNLFDYSGEVTSDMAADDFRRRRALEADGYLFFLDPTYPSGPQAKALVDFREDLRLLKGLPPGSRVLTPMALCVSKIDLLSKQPYALPEGGDAVGRFYEELERIDPTGEALTTEVFAARSQLVSKLRETIWPGWQIERQVEELFGHRYQFFPLTPVGLDGRGESDLSLRTISPFGLLEPLVWLLQMNGYRVMQ